MRRGITLALAIVPSAGVWVGTACAPLFGIESRYAGPTWCEEDAQAIGRAGGYCEDFDRPLAPLSGQQSASLHGTAQVSSDTASSPPNALAIQSVAVDGDGGVLVGNLVSFGPMSMGVDGLPPFKCQADLLASDVAALMEAGVDAAGVLALGGQAMATGAPEVAVLSFQPGGFVHLSLDELPSPNAPPKELSETPCAFNASPELQGDWLTFELLLTRRKYLGDAAVPHLGTACDISPRRSGDGGSGQDGGSPRDAGSAPDGGSHKDELDPYLLFGKVGPFSFMQPAHFDDPTFFGQPYFVYGLFVEGKVAPLSLHFDNVRCSILSKEEAGAP